jgi:hypothetical protein
MKYFLVVFLLFAPAVRAQDMPEFGGDEQEEEENQPNNKTTDKEGESNIDKPEWKSTQDQPTETNQGSTSSETKMPSYLVKPLKVGVMLIVNNLLEINERTDTFEAKIELHLRWHDPTLAFDRTVMGTTRLEYSKEQTVLKLAEIWQPEIFISNMEPNPTRIDPGLFISENGEVEYIRYIEAKFHGDFQLRAFPFDSQMLPIILISKFYNKRELTFDQSQEEASRSKVGGQVSYSGWHINGMTWSGASVRGWDGNYYPEITAFIQVSRNPFGHLIVLIPLAIVMIIPTYLTLYIKRAYMVYRLEAWGGSLLAMVATTFTLNLRYPTLDPHSIVNRMFFLFFLFQVFMIALTISLFNTEFTNRFKNQYLIEEIKKFLRWSIPLGFIVIVIVNGLLIVYY